GDETGRTGRNGTGRDGTGRDTCDERAARGRRARERPGAGDRPVRDSADAELRGAGGPGAPALLGLDLLGDVDLLGAAGLVGGGGVLAAAEGPPGLTRELQAAVVAVAGVDRPVAAGLALRDAVPDGTRRGGRCRGAAVLRGGRVLGAALGAAVGRARAGALLGLLLALLLGLGRLGRGLGSGLRLLLGALGDDLGDRLGDDVLGDDLGLGDLAVDDGLGVDELLGAGLALGGGLGGALVQGVVLDGLRLERDLLGLGALVLAHALDLMGGAVLEHGIARDVGGVGVLDVAEHLLHRVAHGQR